MRPKEKWQPDAKYVPQACYVGKADGSLFWYTRLEEACRERFIYAYREQSDYSTVDFVKRAVCPKIIQTDNGNEVCNSQNTKYIHMFRPLICGMLQAIQFVLRLRRKAPRRAQTLGFHAERMPHGWMDPDKQLDPAKRKNGYAGCCATRADQ